MGINSENSPEYSAGNPENEIIKQALQILETRIKKTGDILSSVDDTKNYLKIRMAGLEHEIFSCLFLDNRHAVISYQEIFRGTVNGASVYPREILKEALKHNASAVIFAHNHPSGEVDPSNADKQITNTLKSALALVDIRVLDHLIVGNSVFSFAESGLI